MPLAHAQSRHWVTARFAGFNVFLTISGLLWLYILSRYFPVLLLPIFCKLHDRTLRVFTVYISLVRSMMGI